MNFRFDVINSIAGKSKHWKLSVKVNDPADQYFDKKSQVWQTWKCKIENNI